jgi:Flp pilus assembly protein TadG
MRADDARRGAGRRRAGRGQSLVEFALLLPVLALLLVGALDLGRAFYSAVQLTNSVREGANFGRLSPSAVGSSDTPDPDNIRFKVQDESELVINDADVVVRCYVGPTIGSTTLRGDGSCSAASGVRSGDIIEVTARYQFQPITTQLVRILPPNYKITKTLRMVIA